jgi:hypothetical protein
VTAPRRDAGSATLEVLILVPILLVLANVALYAGQMRMLHSLTRDAAEAAARQMTASRTWSRAVPNMNNTVGLIQGGDSDIRCHVGNVQYTTSSNQPMSPGNIGTAESFTVTVSCQFPVRMISAPGVGKYVTVQESATSYVDPYRYRS